MRKAYTVDDNIMYTMLITDRSGDGLSYLILLFVAEPTDQCLRASL